MTSPSEQPDFFWAEAPAAPPAVPEPGYEVQATMSEAKLGPEDAGFQDAAQRILALHLETFERSDLEGIEVRVPWWPTQLFWFVPREAQAEALVNQGISRGRIFTTAELRRLLVAAPSSETFQFFVRGKVFMDGEVQM